MALEAGTKGELTEPVSLLFDKRDEAVYSVALRWFKDRVHRSVTSLKKKKNLNASSPVKNSGPRHHSYAVPRHLPPHFEPDQALRGRRGSSSDS